MLLLRTKAAQVAAHVDGIVERYPTPNALATQRLQVAEKAFRPLGLRWRARRLHECARVIVGEYGGTVPLSLDELLQLPGVGPYVAASTLASLTGVKVVLIDTNTVRVATRVAGVRLLGDIRRRRAVREAIGSLLGGPALARDWLAVLDLAATVCLPRVPKCQICPIRRHCAYGKDVVARG
jgi:A/G-specific adenine glycosylase